MRNELIEQVIRSLEARASTLKREIRELQFQVTRKELDIETLNAQAKELSNFYTIHR